MIMANLKIEIMDEEETYFPFASYEDWYSFKKLFSDFQFEAKTKAKMDSIIKQSEDEIKEVLSSIIETK